MKGIILITAFIFSTNLLFAQYYMEINLNDGSKILLPVGDIENIQYYTPCPGIPTVTYSGKTYNTVQIGSQCWLKENIDVGTRINWNEFQTDNDLLEKYCYDNNDANCTTYGGLYQWAETVQYQNGATNFASPDPPFTGNVQGICPTGWHIPTIDEFTALQTEVSDDGNALKDIGQGTGSGEGTNISGFSALLAGFTVNVGCDELGSMTYFWTTKESTILYAWELSLNNNLGSISQSQYPKTLGFSVRCIKD